MNETANASIYIELAKLYERAQRALDEAHRLAAERSFLVNWHRMRPRPHAKIIPASILDE